MIVEYLRYTIETDRQDAFVTDYKKGAAELITSPYAHSFELCQCVEDPTQFILRIEWTSAEDHLQKFRQSAPFTAFFAHIKPYLGAIDEMRHYDRKIELT